MAKRRPCLRTQSQRTSRIWRRFCGLVVIDQALPELHHVLKKISAETSVLEMRAYRSNTGEFIYQFDTPPVVREERLPNIKDVGPRHSWRQASGYVALMGDSPP